MRNFPFFDKTMFDRFHDLKIPGAWWLGWIILGVITLLFAVLIGLFPKELPKRKKQNADEYKFGSGKICEQSAKISENMKIVDDDKNKDENVNLESKHILLVSRYCNSVVIDTEDEQYDASS